MNWVLTANFWEPFGRLTFGAYLVHPALLRIAYYSRVHLFYYTPVEYASYYTGALLSAYFVAYVLWLIVECPSSNMVVQLMRPRSHVNVRKEVNS